MEPGALLVASDTCDEYNVAVAGIKFKFFDASLGENRFLVIGNIFVYLYDMKLEGNFDVNQEAYKRLICASQYGICNVAASFLKELEIDEKI